MSAAVMAGMDLPQLSIATLQQFQSWQGDEILVAAGILVAGSAMDRAISARRALRATEIQEQRLRVLKATMRTVQHIVNNNLNNLVLIRQEADDLLSAESLALFDRVITEMSDELTACANLDATPEREMNIGPCIDCPPPSRSFPSEPAPM